MRILSHEGGFFEVPNMARHYDPALGRYLQADPIGLAGGSNLYAYVGGDPVNFVDPLGLYDMFIGGAADSMSNIVKDYANDFSQKHPDRVVSYFNWDKLDDIVGAVNAMKQSNPCEPINLIGHSWGGDTAAQAAVAVGGVDLLIMIDPVGSHAQAGLNVNAHQKIDVQAFLTKPDPEDSTGKRRIPDSNGFGGDIWADWGGQWKTGYHAPYHHNEFAEMMGYAPSKWSKSPYDALVKSNKACGCK